VVCGVETGYAPADSIGSLAHTRRILKHGFSGRAQPDFSNNQNVLQGWELCSGLIYTIPADKPFFNSLSFGITLFAL
jgi:hypothetical protein